ncbi:MAG: 50S ribosome-binding GTPase, partial [Deltaproteobacteria bacterium]|nr:50S ribosome-binding GTPase [Deltaproteobacteria bacterium]
MSELILAKSRKEAELAAKQLSGSLKEAIREIREQLLTVLGSLEVAIDYPEEHLEILNETPSLLLLTGIAARLDDLIDQSETGRIFREGLSLAIVGRPNVGKSSLFNTLLGLNRAIVTPVPGTTRDYLEADALLEGLAVKLVDTAGLESEPNDQIEAEGQLRALEKLREADLVLVVVDQSRPFGAGDLVILRQAPEG